MASLLGKWQQSPNLPEKETPFTLEQMLQQTTKIYRADCSLSTR
jgi:hypothetical protein